MTNKVESRRSALVDYLITLFARATQPREIELIAGHLGTTGDPRAIRPLLTRLGDQAVREHRDVEDAVCRALTSLGVMSTSGHSSFSLRPKDALPGDVSEAIRELAGSIPTRYLGTPPSSGSS